MPGNASLRWKRGRGTGTSGRHWGRVEDVRERLASLEARPRVWGCPGRCWGSPGTPRFVGSEAEGRGRLGTRWGRVEDVLERLASLEAM